MYKTWICHLSPSTPKFFIPLFTLTLEELLYTSHPSQNTWPILDSSLSSHKDGLILPYVFLQTPPPLPLYLHHLRSDLLSGSTRSCSFTWPKKWSRHYLLLQLYLFPLPTLWSDNNELNVPDLCSSYSQSPECPSHFSPKATLNILSILHFDTVSSK